MNLGQLASIRSGLVLSRKQARGISEFCYPLLTLRAIRADGTVDVDQLDRYLAAEELSPDYLSHEGDIVIRLSSPYTAILIDHKTANMVISSNFVIIRTDAGQLLPEYLYWLLNTPKVKRQIYENTSSNMLGAIKPTYFSNFSLAPLSLSDQKKIADLNMFAQREVHLLEILAREKEKYYACMIEQAQKAMRERSLK
jgi:hypothetical protein